MNTIKEKNIKFLILQSIGIILVVLGHGKNGGLTLFTDWFTPYSFHIPLFIFISGYFYKNENSLNYKEFLIKKVKRLLIPYFIWNIVYGVIITMLKYYNIVDFGETISINSLFIEPLKNGHQFRLNLASWFVITLFIIEIVYTLFRKLNVLKNEYVIMILLIIIGCLGVIMSNEGYNNDWYLPLVRVMFLIPFFHIGYIYKSKIEKKDTLNNFTYFTIIFLIQYLLIITYSNNLQFVVAWCDGFNKNNILLPYITSLTGIMFWLRISKILVPALEKSKIIYYIGTNTWSIMMHHLFIFFILNSILSLIAPILNFPAFDYKAFRQDIFYSYIPNINQFSLSYVIIGIAIPIIMKLCWKRIKNINR